MFSSKPAPVQVNWLGYHSTTGLPTMDYLFTDQVSSPAMDTPGYSETLWPLPHSRLPLFRPDICLASPLPCTKENAPFTFGCFQNTQKINDKVMQVWSEILAACPYSHLRVQSANLGNPEIKTTFAARLGAAGIASNRYTLLPDTGMQAYIQAHAEVDLILDTFPYPGGTTTNFALWQGVPTLTLATPGMLGRQGEMLMKAAGLPDWVCDTLHSYQTTAIHYGSRTPQALKQLATLRKALPAQLARQPAADMRLFARNLHTALRDMWRNYCKNQPV